MCIESGEPRETGRYNTIHAKVIDRELQQANVLRMHSGWGG